MSLLRVLATSLVLAASTSEGGDWPQILGPDRNGIAANEQIVDELSAPPELLWKRQVGDGYAGVAISGDVGFLFHRIEDNERLEAFDVLSGKTLWTSDSPTNYSGAIASDDGPRCVPTVTDRSVIIFGAQGNLRCLDKKNGRELWSHQTHEAFNAQEGYFGAGSSPLVEQQIVLVNVGASRSDAGIVAFDLKSGEVRWKATDEQASYSSPIAVTLDQQRQAIFVTRLNCLGLEPASGKVLWSLPFGARGPTVNAANPVVLNDRLFLTASYGVGAVYAQFDASGATEIWRNRDLLASQYSTPIEHRGALYGIDGRQDVGSASLRCIDPTTQSVLWEEKDFGYSTLIKADSKLLVQKTDGTLVLVSPSKTGYRELGRAMLASDIGTIRALPALANGKYLVRDEKQLYCFELSSTR